MRLTRDYLLSQQELSLIKVAKIAKEATRVIGKDRWSMILKTMYAEPKLGGFGMSMETIAEKLDKDNRTINRWLKQLEAEGVLKTRPARTPRSIGRLTSHKWLERKELERLTDGTYAMVDHVYAFPELCYIIGFTIGDGFVFYGRSRRDKTAKCERGIVLLNTDFELLNPMLLRAEKVAQRFGVKLTVKYYDQNVGRSHAKKPIVGTCIFGARLWQE